MANNNPINSIRLSVAESSTVVTSQKRGTGEGRRRNRVCAEATERAGVDSKICSHTAVSLWGPMPLTSARLWVRDL